MRKINNIFINITAVIIALFGILNIIDSIYASSYVDAAQSGLTMTANINSSATVSVSANTVNLNITPSAGGTFGSGSINVNTYTNTSNNCTVTMSANSSDLTSASGTIPSLTNAVSESNFPNDRWGYRVGSTGNYNAVATTNNAITSYTTNTGNTAQSVSVNFAAKLSAATKPGTYTNVLTFSSVCAQ